MNNSHISISDSGCNTECTSALWPLRRRDGEALIVWSEATEQAYILVLSNAQLCVLKTEKKASIVLRSVFKSTWQTLNTPLSYLCKQLSWLKHGQIFVSSADLAFFFIFASQSPRRLNKHCSISFHQCSWNAKLTGCRW